MDNWGERGENGVRNFKTSNGALEIVGFMRAASFVRVTVR